MTGKKARHKYAESRGRAAAKNDESVNRADGRARSAPTSQVNNRPVTERRSLMSFHAAIAINSDIQSRSFYCHSMTMTGAHLIAFPLEQARVHEVCGPTAVTFALISAAISVGPVLWVRRASCGEALCPHGLSAFIEVSDLFVAHAETHADSLSVAEEALRCGAMSMVVVEVTKALDLREGRRLQLAAREGQTRGLCIIPDGMGANTAETRWHVQPLFDPECQDSTLMRWELKKNKKGTVGVWHVRWAPKTRGLHVVSPLVERSLSETKAG